LLIPAIIYGVAIVDLLKIFSHRKNYFEMVGWGIFVLLVVVFSWMELYHKLESVTGNNLNFFLIIAQSILFSQAAALITPEQDIIDTKAYFFEKRKNFFFVLIAISLLGFVMQYLVFDDQKPSWIRPLAITFFLIGAYSNKTWLRTAVLVSGLLILGAMIFTNKLM
jgi:hypothetical protein